MNQAALSSFSSTRNTRSLLSGALIAITLFATQSAQAASESWNGATGGTWATGSNWTTPSATPTSAYDLTILGASNANGGSALTINIAAAAAANSLTFTNTGTGANGDTLQASSTAETLTISAGGGTGITTGTGAVTIGSTTAANAVNVALGASQTWSIGAGGLTVDNIVSGSGKALTVGGTGTLTLNGTNTYSGGTTINSGATAQISTATGFGASSGTVADNGTAIVNVSGVTVANAFSGTGILNLSNLGSGSTTTTLSGDLSGFTGTLNIGSGGGKVQFTASTNGQQISSSATVNVLSGSTLYIATGLTYGSSLTLDGGSTGEGLGNLRLSGSTTWSGSVTLDATSTIGAFTSTAGTISGAIGDGGLGYGVTKVGSGTITLSGANTYSGVTTISGGALALGNNLALQDSTLATSSGSVILSVTTPTIGGLTGSTNLATFITSGYTGSVTALTLNPQSGVSDTYSGVIADGATGMNLIMSGSGTQTLSGANTYSGSTTVTAGTLVIGATGSLINSTNISVGAGAALTVTGGGSIPTATALTDNGTTTLNNATTTIATLNGTNTGALLKLNTTNLTVSSGGSFAGVIQNGTSAGALTVSGGTLTLSGANTYTGSTTVSAGTLKAGVASVAATSGAFGLNSAVTVSGGKLDLNGFNETIGSLSDGGISTGTVTDSSTAAVLTTSANTTTAYSGLISGALTLTKGGSGTLTLSGANTFTGQFILNNGTVSVSSIGNAGSNGNLGAAAQGADGSAPLILGANTNSVALIYTGAGETNTRNIDILNTAAKTVTITDNGGALNLGGTIYTNSGGATAVQTQLILNGSQGGELSGNFVRDSGSSSPGVSIQGGGTWIFSGSRNYSNVTDVENGTLQFDSIANAGASNPSALGTAANLTDAWLPNISTFQGGGTSVPYAISLGTASASASTSTGTIQYIGTSSASSNRNIGLNGNGDISNIAASGGNALTLSGTITPIASVTGGLTLFLDGTNTNANTISGVISNLSSTTGATNAGFASGSSTITLVSTAGLSVGETITGTNLNAVILAINSGTITLSSATTGTVTSGEVLTTTPTSLGLTKQGAGTWVLTNANTYSGATTVSAGTLQIGAGGTSGSLGSASSVSVSSGATLVFDRTDNYGGNFSTAITDGAVAGGAVTVSAGTLTTIAANTYTGSTTIGSGATLQLGAGGTVGALSASSTITDNGTFAIDRTDAVSQGTVLGSTTIFGNAITGSGGLTQSGSGTTTLTGSNSYLGGTLINAGTLALQGAGASLYSAGAVVDNATFDISQSANQTIGTLNGSGVVNLGAHQLSTIAGAGTNTFSGNIKDGGLGSGTGGSLLVDGGQLLVLSGSNSFTGTTTIGTASHSVLQYSGANAIGATSNIVVGLGSTVQLAGIGTSGSSTQTLTLEGGTGGADGAAGGSLESVSGNNTLADTVNMTATSDIFADSGSTLSLSGAISSTAVNSTQTLFLKGLSTGTSTVSGAISNGSSGGKIALNENTSGTWVLSNTNSYTGATTVAAGNLQVTGSLASGSAVTVGNNTGVAILSGTGTINGSLTTATTGSHIAYIAPGVNTTGARGDFGSVGTLSVGTLNFTVGNGTQFDYDINTSTGIGGANNDLIAMGGGTLSVGSSIVFNFDQLTALTTGTAYTLIDGAGSISNFNASNFSATGIGSDTATFSTSGGSLLVTFNSTVVSNSYYFTGSNTGSFTDAGNYYSAASGGSQQSTALSSTSNVYLNATSPTATNTPDTLNTSASINSLNFVTAGTSLAGSGTVTLAATGTAGITDSAGTAGQTETVAPSVILGANQSWASTANSTLNVTGNVSGAQSLQLTGNGSYKLGGANTFQGLTVGTGSDTPTLYLTNGTNGSATGTTTLSVMAGATLAGNGTSSGTSFNISGTGTATGARANILVGLTSATDTTVGNVLTLNASGSSTIADANLTFNLDAKSTASNQLSVGTTAIAFGTDPGSVKLTLNLQNEPAIVGAYTMYTLIAGTSSTDQYTGLTLGNSTTIAPGVTETMITGNNLQLAFGNSVDQSYYGNGSYLVLYQSAGVDDIDVVVVPEPGTWALMLGGLAVLIYWQRRKRT